MKTTTIKVEYAITLKIPVTVHGINITPVIQLWVGGEEDINELNEDDFDWVDNEDYPPQMLNELGKHDFEKSQKFKDSFKVIYGKHFEDLVLEEIKNKMPLDVIKGIAQLHKPKLWEGVIA